MIDNYPAGASNYFDEKPSEPIGKDFTGLMIYDDDHYFEYMNDLILADDVIDYAKHLMKKNPQEAAEIIGEYIFKNGVEYK